MIYLERIAIVKALIALAALAPARIYGIAFFLSREFIVSFKLVKNKIVKKDK
jgi:hypothetical protein